MKIWIKELWYTEIQIKSSLFLILFSKTDFRNVLCFFCNYIIYNLAGGTLLRKLVWPLALSIYNLAVGTLLRKLVWPSCNVNIQPGRWNAVTQTSLVSCIVNIQPGRWNAVSQTSLAFLHCQCQ